MRPGGSSLASPFHRSVITVIHTGLMGLGLLAGRQLSAERELEQKIRVEPLAYLVQDTHLPSATLGTGSISQ